MGLRNSRAYRKYYIIKIIQKQAQIENNTFFFIPNEIGNDARDSDYLDKFLIDFSCPKTSFFTAKLCST